jgi:hypothetical protein
VAVFFALTGLPSLGTSLSTDLADVPSDVCRVPIKALAAEKLENMRLRRKIEQLEVAMALSPATF